MKSLYTQKTHFEDNDNCLSKIIHHQISTHNLFQLRMHKTNIMHLCNEKDFLFISSLLDYKNQQPNTWHTLTSSCPENEPAYEKVVHSSSCNEILKVILPKVSTHDYALLQKICAKSMRNKRKLKTSFPLPHCHSSKIESKFCTSEHYQHSIPIMLARRSGNQHQTPKQITLI